MTSTKRSDSDFSDELPTLTEIVAEATPHLHPALSAKESQQLLQRLEKHLETLFNQKLALRLEQLQRQAVKQALGELKTELPGLLQDALNAHLDT